MDLKIADICRLIKVCHETGVTKVEFGNLVVQFATKEPGADTPKQEFSIPRQVVETEAEAIASHEVKIKEDKLDLLLIENPAEYERLVLAGELDEEDDS